MNYISREKFLAQPVEVQNSMKEWYKEYFKDGNDFSLINYNSVDTCYHTLVALNEDFNIDECTPLFTEEDLRKFIEYKTNSTIMEININYHGKKCKYSYTMNIWKSAGEEMFFDYTPIVVEADDMLQMYWKIACRVCLQKI